MDAHRGDVGSAHGGMSDRCIAPDRSMVRCPLPTEPGSVFCRKHECAPAGRRGGWVSAEMRRRRRAASEDRPLDISNITPPRPGGRSDGPRRSLWVGAAPPFDRDLPGFDVLVLCTKEIQPEQVGFHGYTVRCPISDDILSPLEIRLVLEAAPLVSDSMVARRHVLVTCAQGINRSVLVASLALARITRLSADDLIRIMRRRRHPSALYNPHFQDLLRSFISRR